MAGEQFTDCIVADLASPTRNALVGGPFGSDLVSKDYVPFGVPVIRGTNMGHGRWVDGEFAFVTHAKADSLSANCAKPGDLVFTQRGTLGQVALVPSNVSGRYLISQSQMKLTVDETKADALFLYYVFTSAEQQEYIRQNAIQTGVPHTNLGILRNTRLTLPPLPEQKAIAAILGALDDKIELNRRMNATLESMARALFQSWFVDFDPVRAKADGRTPSGMDAETAALFPSQFDHDDGFFRPRGWPMSRLGDHVDLIRGNTYKSSLKDTPGPYLLGLGAIHRNGGFRDDSLRTYGGESAPKLILRPGDLFASLKDVTQAADLLGAVARVPGEIAAGRLTQDTVKLVPQGSNISMAYLYHTLLRPECREYCRGRATGTTNLGLSREDFLNYPVLIPPPELQQSFDRFESHLEANIANNRLQSRTLAALRDTLLPKLLRGEVRVVP